MSLDRELFEVERPVSSSIQYESLDNLTIVPSKPAVVDEIVATEQVIATQDDDAAALLTLAGSGRQTQVVEQTSCIYCGVSLNLAIISQHQEHDCYYRPLAKKLRVKERINTFSDVEWARQAVTELESNDIITSPSPKSNENSPSADSKRKKSKRGHYV